MEQCRGASRSLRLVFPQPGGRRRGAGHTSTSGIAPKIAQAYRKHFEVRRVRLRHTKLHSAILTYHSLDDSGSVISISPSSFRGQMEFLARSGIPVVPLEKIQNARESIALTFDDGFQNFIQHALPVLEQHAFPATIFVVSGYCGRRNNWPGQTAGAAPDLPLLSWDELSALPPSISIGAHTATHQNLRHLPAQRRESELRECRAEIEQRLGRRVRSLAYPYGASSPNVRELAAKYF